MSQYEVDVNGKRWMLVPIEPADQQVDVIRHAVIEGDLHHRQTYANVLGMSPPRTDGLIPLAEALLRMVKQYQGNSEWILFSIKRVSMSPEHLTMLLQKILSGDVTGEKAHRWIGWVQASLVAAGVTHLGAMMSITRDHLRPNEAAEIEEPFN